MVKEFFRNSLPVLEHPVYDSSQKILIVGEADFSFAFALAKQGCSNMIATSYESYDQVSTKYGNAMTMIEDLTTMGVDVRFNIDATRLTEQIEINNFDRILFMNPHAHFGGRDSKPYDDVLENRAIIYQFLQQGSKLLSNMGEIHLTKKQDGRKLYRRWGIYGLAEKPLSLKGVVRFESSRFPDYQTCKTFCNANGMYFDDITLVMFVFHFGDSKKFGETHCALCARECDSLHNLFMHSSSKYHKLMLQLEQLWQERKRELNQINSLEKLPSTEKMKTTISSSHEVNAEEVPIEYLD